TPTGERSKFSSPGMGIRRPVALTPPDALEGRVTTRPPTYRERGAFGAITRPYCLVLTITRGHVPSPGSVRYRTNKTVERARRLRATPGIALGDGWRSRCHLSRRRDTNQPREAIELPIKTGEQPYLALTTG